MPHHLDPRHSVLFLTSGCQESGTGGFSGTGEPVRAQIDSTNFRRTPRRQGPFRICLGVHFRARLRTDPPSEASDRSVASPRAARQNRDMLPLAYVLVMCLLTP